MAVETLWERIGLKKIFDTIIRQKHLRMPYERALLAMAANRLCEPDSKLGVWDRWLETVFLTTCENLKLRHMYEAMDLLYDHAAGVESVYRPPTTNRKLWMKILGSSLYQISLGLRK